jgi:hypothetical protein
MISSYVELYSARPDLIRSSRWDYDYASLGKDVAKAGWLTTAQNPYDRYAFGSVIASASIALSMRRASKRSLFIGSSVSDREGLVL